MMSEKLLARLREHNSTGVATRPVYVRMLLDEIERLRAELADIRKRRSVWPPADDEDT